MKRVRCNRPDLPETAIGRIARSLTEFREYFANGAAGERPIVDRSINRIYKKTLSEEFHGKCAYCDRRLTTQLEGDVEHIRPKNRVCDEHGTQIRSARYPDRDHPGYWWLAYDWENLVISCKECNTRFKRDKFPVEGSHAESEGETDIGLLINHHEENPMDHFAINVTTGELVPLTQKGRVSAHVLSLNREQLRDERVFEFNKAQAVLAVAVNQSVDDNTRGLAIRTIVRYITNQEEHSIFCAASLDRMVGAVGATIDFFRAQRTDDAGL